MMTDNDVLAHLDWTTVTCQCQQHACVQAGGCKNPATEHVEFHAIDHCTKGSDELNPFGNYTFLLCMPCLEDLAATVGDHIARLNRYGLKTCITCGAPIAELKDAIREVNDL